MHDIVFIRRPYEHGPVACFSDPARRQRAAHDDGVPTDCVVNFDNIHTLPRQMFRRQVTALTPGRLAEACRTLAAATGC